jgi:hypothetical protein
MRAAPIHQQAQRRGTRYRVHFLTIDLLLAWVAVGLSLPVDSRSRPKRVPTVIADDGQLRHQESRSSSPATVRLSLMTPAEKDRTMSRICWSAIVLLLALSPGSGRAQGSRVDESPESIAISTAPPASTQPSGATLIGRVSLTAADGRRFPAPGTRLTLTCATQSAPLIETSDETGKFRFGHARSDTCEIVAQLQGFRSTSTAVVMLDQEITNVELHLDVEPVFTGVMVTGKPPSTPRSRCRAAF